VKKVKKEKKNKKSEKKPKKRTNGLEFRFALFRFEAKFQAAFFCVNTVADNVRLTDLGEFNCRTYSILYSTYMYHACTYGTLLPGKNM
jgi:hypothetical protein